MPIMHFSSNIHEFFHTKYTRVVKKKVFMLIIHVFNSYHEKFKMSASATIKFVPLIFYFV